MTSESISTIRRIALYSAGSNAKGQLAHGTEHDSDRFNCCEFIEDKPLLSGSITSISLALGANHTLLLLTDSRESSLWACGDGRRGQLGADFQQAYGTSSSFRRIEFNRSEGYKYSLIAASWETSFVCLHHPERSDILLSLGSDDFGDRGVGGLRSNSTDVCETPISFEHLFEGTDDLSPLIRIAEIKAGPHVVIVKLEYGSDGNTQTLIAGWGVTRHGQLGNPAIVTGRPFASSPILVHVPDASYASISSFALGSQHTVFRTSIGSVYALGSDRKMQQRGLDVIRRADAIGTTWNGSYIVEHGDEGEDWSIYATGSNGKGQLGSLPSNSSSHVLRFPHLSFRGLSCGSEHVLLLAERSDGHPSQNVGKPEVWGWGWNEHGNLGLGHTDDAHEPSILWPTSEEVSLRSEVIAVWAGPGTSWLAIEIEQENECIRI